MVLSEGDRILFVIPWGERVILGTTDTDYDGDPAAVRTDAVRHELHSGRGEPRLPRRADRRADVISTWAGVRPLIAPGQ